MNEPSGSVLPVRRRLPLDPSPPAMFKRLSLTQRLLAGTALAVTLAFGILLAITVQQSRQSAVEQAELGMRTQLDLVVTMLDYAQDALKTRARDQLTLLEHELPGKASLGAPVATGKLELPRLRFGDLEGSNNPEFLEAYRKRNSVDAALLVRDGNALYRASTLLKDAEGKYRVGEEVKDNYAAILLRGETYAGTLQRNGRLYVLGAKPLLDAAETLPGEGAAVAADTKAALAKPGAAKPGAKPVAGAIPAGTIAPARPIMMVQRSPNIFFQTSKAVPRLRPWNAVPCIRSSTLEMVPPWAGSKGRVGVERRSFLVTYLPSHITASGADHCPGCPPARQRSPAPACGSGRRVR